MDFYTEFIQKVKNGKLLIIDGKETKEIKDARIFVDEDVILLYTDRRLSDE